MRVKRALLAATTAAVLTAVASVATASTNQDSQPTETADSASGALEQISSIDAEMASLASEPAPSSIEVGPVPGVRPSRLPESVGDQTLANAVAGSLTEDAMPFTASSPESASGYLSGSGPVAPKVYPDSMLKPPGKPAVRVVSTQAASVDFYCEYNSSNMVWAPAPPVSGDSNGSFSVASAVYAPEPVTGNQAYQRLPGFSSATSGRSSYVDVNYNVRISSFPAGSLMTFYSNPTYSGRGVTATSYAPGNLFRSSASFRYELWTGVGINGDLNWQLWFNVGDTNNAGTGKASPVYYWGGLPRGQGYARNIPITAFNATYTFRMSTRVYADATAQIGAGASSQADFGSAVLDTPANLSPGGYGTSANTSGSTNGQPGYRLPGVTVKFTVPAGNTVRCS